MFERKRYWRHKVITPALLVQVGALLLLAGCAPDPARLQAEGLFDQLVRARRLFAEQPPQLGAACNVVGDVQNRLYGEPGLSDVRPGWPALLAGAQALQSVCGQSTLLGQPGGASLTLAQSRQRWERGVQREMGVACDHLRVAAAALSRTAPC